MKRSFRSRVLSGKVVHEKSVVKQYFFSPVVVHTVETHPHAGDDAVEDGDQRGDTTLHTRVTRCHFDSSKLKRRFKRMDSNCTLFGCSRPEESSARNDDSDTVEPLAAASSDTSNPVAKAGAPGPWGFPHRVSGEVAVVTHILVDETHDECNMCL